MAKASHPTISLWARAEPFAYGIFQVHPHPRLAVHNIKKLVSYSKSKGRSVYPKLSYSVWKHVACNKLQLTEDLAWVLFHTCLTMATCNTEIVGEIEERLGNAGTLSDQERVKNSQQIELFTFVLFLYIQQINKISLRASAVSANAEWPGTYNRSSDLDSGRSTPIRPCRNLDEQYHLQFVTENLSEMLDLLVEPDGYDSNGLDACISEEAIDSLSLILEGTADQGRSLSSFSELVRMPSVQHATGYVKVSHMYHLRGLHSWIRSWLTSNPFSVENCIRNGRRLTWRLPQQLLSEGSVPPGPTAQSQPDVPKRQKIATNAHQIPRIGGRGGNKLVIMSMISRQIIARSSATLDGATLKVQRAHCSYLYLLSPMRSVTLDKCRKLTIVLGPIENTLQLNNCEDCLVISACRRAVLAACRRCTLHLCIPSRPILIQPPIPTGTTSAAGPTALSPATAMGTSTPTTPGTPTPPTGAVTLLGNEEILLAPFHTTYYRLSDHMMRVNLSPNVNFWDKPFLLGHDSNRNEQVAGMPIPGRGRYWDLLRPTHFYPFNIPLPAPGKSEGLEAFNSSDSPQRVPISQLDLSAILVTDTQRWLNVSGNSEDYTKLANTRLAVPLPIPYLEALKERASVYQRWPQYIANARLTTEQRQLFGTVVDQRFRQWLSESGNLRQLQLLELSTGQNATTHQAGPTKDGDAASTVPPTGMNVPSDELTAGARTGSGRPNSALGRRDRQRSGVINDNSALNGTCMS